MAEVQARYPAEWQRREKDLVTFRPPAGESFTDFSVRIAPVFNQIVQELEGDILIVAHAGVNRVILCQVWGWIWPTFSGWARLWFPESPRA